METSDLQIKIYDAECVVQSGTKIFRVHMPVTPEFASTRDQIKQYQRMQSSLEALAWAAEQKKQLAETGQCKIATSEYPLRWAGGGLMYVAGDEILTVKKDFGPNEPSRLSLLTGVSKSQEEIHEPTLTAAREGLEECVMVKDGAYAVPVLPFVKWSSQNSILNSVREKVSAAANASRIEELACRTTDYNKQRLEVYGLNGDLRHVYSASLVWLPKAASLDLIFAVELSYDIKSLDMYDTEENKGELLKRDFVFVPISTIRSRQQKLDQELYVKNSWKSVNGQQQVQTTLGKLLMELEL